MEVEALLVLGIKHLFPLINYKPYQQNVIINEATESLKALVVVIIIIAKEAILNSVITSMVETILY